LTRLWFLSLRRRG